MHRLATGGAFFRYISGLLGQPSGEMRDANGTKQARPPQLPAGAACVYCRLGQRCREKGSRRPPGPRLRHQEHGHKIRRKDLGAGRKENAAAGPGKAAVQVEAAKGGSGPGLLRGPAEPVHRLQLYPAQHRNSPPGALRRLFHDGPEPAAVHNGRWRRLCGPGGGHDLLPLCRLRAAVPLPPGLRRSADPHRPVDRHRLRRGPGDHRTRPHRHRIGHHRHRPGPRDHRRQQHGRGNGPRWC